MTVIFEEVSEFTREFKKLSKKYKSLNEDLETYKKALLDKLPNYPPGTVQISNIGKKVTTPIYKVRHFRCKALKGCGVRSGIRIIFAHVPNEEKITFIEIYREKNSKTNHDIKRILKCFKGG